MRKAIRFSDGRGSWDRDALNSMIRQIFHHHPCDQSKILFGDLGESRTETVRPNEFYL